MQYIDKPQSIVGAIYSKRQVLGIVKQLAAAYRVMHGRSYSHSDIKPDNVLLELNNMTGLLVPYVTDFGISRLVDKERSQVHAFELSDIKGLSLRYAAPELFIWVMKSAKIDPLQKFMNDIAMTDLSILLRSDVYAFAVLVYEMACRGRAWVK